MDCLEFRRQLGCGTAQLDAAAQAHLASCTAGCAEAAAEAQAFDARLAAALAVPVPGALAGRVQQAQRSAAAATDPAPRRRTAWIAFAAAASLALAFGVAQWRRNAVPLQDLVAAHVTAPGELAAWGLRDPLPDTRVEAAFSDRGVPLASPPPQGIAYVAECGVGRWPSVHMVMPEQGQPVSVVYVPGHAGAATETFQRDQLNGRAVAVGNGTLFLLARSDVRFDALERAWRGAIEGPAQVAAGSH
jgi:hypothetical protein